MTEAEQQLAKIDAAIDEGPGVLMLSPPAFDLLKQVVPRRERRKRKGTRFVNAYRGCPIELHDEWAWGWLVRQ